MGKTALLAIRVDVPEIRPVVVVREYVARRIVAAHITMISDCNQLRHEVGGDSVHHGSTLSGFAAHSRKHATQRAKRSCGNAPARTLGSSFNDRSLRAHTNFGQWTIADTVRGRYLGQI